MSSNPTVPTPNNPAPAAPAPITVNTPAAEIAAANAASQQTDTPGQPRNADGTFAPVAAAPVAPVEPSPEQPVVTRDLGGGQIEVKYLTGETFKGTVAEVATKIGQSHVTTKQWAQGEVARAKQPPEVLPPPPPSPFADPQEEAVAQYTANLVAKTLGYPDAQTMVRALGHIQDSTTDYSSQLTALQFQAKAPDYNPTPENNEKMFSVIMQSGISDEEFGSKTREQQVMLMQQAHAYCIATNQYAARPATAATPSRIPQPPPPAPTTGSRPLDMGGNIPPELQASPSDSLEVIKQKWEKAAALGLVAPRG